MAEGGLHFASVLEIDPGDYVVLDNLVIEVSNSPRHAIKDGVAEIKGRTASHAAHHRVPVTTGISTEQMLPRLDDDFDLDACDVDAGQILSRSAWPDLPVIYVELAREVRFAGALGGCQVRDVNGFYVRRSDGDGAHHVYTSLGGESVLDASTGDRIISWREARPADFVAAGEH